MPGDVAGGRKAYRLRSGFQAGGRDGRRGGSGRRADRAPPART